MMTMFHKDSKSPAMIKHSMDMIWNKGQPIAVALDQPLYAITKHIQWRWPDIANGGFAEPLLSGSKVLKTRYAGQVTLCALKILLKRAYNDDAQTHPFKEWKRNKENKYPQFKFWSLTCDMEMLLLHFARSLRSKNFKLFNESLEEMLPLFFALDHLNYARWLSVHLKDLKSLSLTNPTIYIAFLEGNFVVIMHVNKTTSWLNRIVTLLG